MDRTAERRVLDQSCEHRVRQRPELGGPDLGPPALLSTQGENKKPCPEDRQTDDAPELAPERARASRPAGSQAGPRRNPTKRGRKKGSKESPLAKASRWEGLAGMGGELAFKELRGGQRGLSYDERGNGMLLVRAIRGCHLPTPAVQEHLEHM